MCISHCAAIKEFNRHPSTQESLWVSLGLSICILCTYILARPSQQSIILFGEAIFLPFYKVTSSAPPPPSSSSWLISAREFSGFIMATFVDRFLWFGVEATKRFLHLRISRDRWNGMAINTIGQGIDVNLAPSFSSSVSQLAMGNAIFQGVNKC